MSLSFTAAAAAASVPSPSDNAVERAASRRRQRGHQRPGFPESRLAVPQPVPAEGVPDPHQDHAGSRGVPDGPGEPDLGRQLRSFGSHHVATSPALVSLLGRILGEYQYAVRRRMNQT